MYFERFTGTKRNRKAILHCTVIGSLLVEFEMKYSKLKCKIEAPKKNDKTSTMVIKNCEILQSQRRK